MGTHPIFESDFDCLTGMASLYYSGRIVVPSTSKTSLHDRFTSLMKNRPSSLGQPSNPSRQGSEKNKRLAAQMESRESVQTALTAERRRGLDQRLGWNNNRRKQPYFTPYGRGGLKGKRAKSAGPEEKNSNNKKDSKKAGGSKRATLNEEELDRELESYVKKRKEMKEQSKNGDASQETAETEPPENEPETTVPPTTTEQTAEV